MVTIGSIFNYDVYMVKRIERYLNLFHSKRRLNRVYSRFLFNRTKRVCSCNIYPTVQMGRCIYIPHPTGITIGETSQLGNNIIIYPGVQLVSNFASEEQSIARRHPEISDNCILCVNSIIVGAVKVGTNCIIAAGAIVTKDVPENTVVIGTNEFRPNRHNNIEYMQKLSKNENRKRIMFYDDKSLNNS